MKVRARPHHGKAAATCLWGPALPRPSHAAGFPTPGTPAAGPALVSRSPFCRCSAFKDEGHLHIDLVLSHPATIELDPLVLDPGRGDPAQRLGGTVEALADRVLETLRRGGGNLGHAGDGHSSPP